MIVTEKKSQHNKEVTKLGGTFYDKSGYRMDVNLWFRHKNEALFYIDSVGKVHGPMDQTYSTRLGPVQKSGNEIVYRREFNEQIEKDQWLKSLDYQKAHPTEVRNETKHFETILRDVTTNNISNNRKSHMTLANHYIPSYKNIETNSYSTTITKNKKPDQGVTVNIVASPSENVFEKDMSITRERRLIDELLEAREELNNLRRARSVVDNSQIENDFRSYNNDPHVSKLVTDVYPSTNTSENLRRRHHSSTQENTKKHFADSTENENYFNRPKFNESQRNIGSTVIDKTFYSELRSRQGMEKPAGQQIHINVLSTDANKTTTEKNPRSNLKSTSSQVSSEIPPVQRVEHINGSQLNHPQEIMGEEKTVTIKRKITKRKKIPENLNTLRDSYIDQISHFQTPHEDISSDTDSEGNIHSFLQKSNRMKVVPVKSVTKLAQPPKEVQEEVIIPVQTKLSRELLPSERMNDSIHLQKTLAHANENLKTPDWEYMDNSIKVGQTPQVHRSNHFESTKYNTISKDKEIGLLSSNRGQTPMAQRNNVFDTTTYSTVTREKDCGPISNYSARKENMKTQQMIGEHSGSLRTLPMERRVAEMTEDIETITLQPIGKGIQDLASGTTTISRPGSRAATPRAFDSSTGATKANYFREEQKHTGSYNTMPVPPKFNKYNSARNISQMSNYDLQDSNRRGLSTGRTTREHSWQTKTESYTMGNRNAHSALSPTSNHESLINTNYITSGFDDSRYPLQMVLNSEDIWYQPNLSREEVINLLREKETGSFIIRNSSTFVGAYGLALKVAFLPENAVRTNDTQSDLIRHFLIETVDDGSGTGVRLKGFANESIYPSLAHLVQDHCLHPGALPTRLVISSYSASRMDHEDSGMAQSQYHYETQQRHQTQSSRAQLLSNAQRSMSSPGVNFIDINHPNPLHRHLVKSALYLGKVDVDKLIGRAAIELAVTKVMTKKTAKTTTVEIRLDSTNGITLTDKLQTLFYTRQFPAQHVLSAQFDPQLREFNSPLLQSNGINRGRIMGVVVRKQKMILRENTVHLFCEIDKSNDLNDIINFINENYLRKA